MNNLTARAAHLRHARVSEPGRIYLITCVTKQRQPLFGDWQCGRLLAQVLNEESRRASTLAYVIMPDHLHWLIQLQDNATLGGLMRSVKSVSSWRINRHLQRRGSIWQTGYQDHALSEEEDLVATARHVVAHPLRVGLVKRIGDYPLWDAAWL